MSPKSPWKSLEPKASQDADQFEFAAMKGTFATIDSAIVDNTISGQIDDEMDAAGVNGPHWQVQDLAEEGLLDSTRREIERRIKILGAGYPFKFSGNKLLYVPSTSGVYEFCLSVTQAPTITAGDYVRFPRIFERLVTYLLKAYFGRHSSALHTGHPRSPATSFKEIMSRLDKGSGEMVWQPQAGLNEVDIKDETLDFVITLPSLDHRSGALYILGQCACGNNWDTKLDDPNIRLLSRWFHPGWPIQPVRAFTTPFVIGDETMRSVVCESGALVFDRPRLIKIAEEWIGQVNKKWIRKRINSLMADIK